MESKNDVRLLVRISVVAFLQPALVGSILSLGGLAVSFFQSGTRAEYTRLASLGPLLVLSAFGVVRAIWVVLVWLSHRRV